ncbi:T9SS type A sorting domain-containing protein [Fluviicola sp.]|uniref:T9SS type A sorting domain-containing protein n=1 Tax=Fluviicola sp. TaxID=1917219 RepID=UPI00281C14F5|nr:T9SS type A sorting domain-containing protein [Fluviicola sp.]
MYPNPAKDKLHFSGTSVQEIIIYDLTGKLVFEASDIENNEVLLNNIQADIYQVVLRTNNHISTQKLVIQK